jgi:hypothetical protein
VSFVLQSEQEEDNMTAKRIDAWERIQIRERSGIWYFFKYTLKDWTSKIFKTDFPEELLCTSFNLFYKKWTGNNDPVNRSQFEDEDAYERAEELYQEIEALLDYWKYRTWKPIDRILDDQMFIRLVKIRHKLNFDSF